MIESNFEGEVEGWVSSEHSCEAVNNSLVVEAEASARTWHFIAPRKYWILRSDLWGAILSFSRFSVEESIYADKYSRNGSKCSTMKPRLHMYDVVIYAGENRKDSDSGNQVGDAIGVHLRRGGGDISVRIGNDAGWEDLQTGSPASETQIRDVLSSCVALLIRPAEPLHRDASEATGKAGHILSSLTRVRLVLNSGSSARAGVEGVGAVGTAGSKASRLLECEDLAGQQAWRAAQDCFLGAAEELQGNCRPQRT